MDSQLLATRYRLKDFEKVTGIKLRGGSSVTDLTYYDELHFWGRQITEHLAFIYLGLQEKVENKIRNKESKNTFFKDILNGFQGRTENLDKHEFTIQAIDEDGFKSKALALWEKWDLLMRKIFLSVKIDADKIKLTQDDITKITEKKEKDNIEKLLTETIRFQSDIHGILKEGKWIGFVYYSFVDHVQKETEYFQKKITGENISLKDELSYIVDHDATEMAVTEKLVDPIEANSDLEKILKMFSNKEFKDITDDEKKVLKNISSEKDIDLIIKYNDAIINNKLPPKLISIINPIIAKHVERELERFKLRLVELKKS